MTKSLPNLRKNLSLLCNNNKLFPQLLAPRTAVLATYVVQIMIDNDIDGAKLTKPASMMLVLITASTQHLPRHFIILTGSGTDWERMWSSVIHNPRGGDWGLPPVLQELRPCMTAGDTLFSHPVAFSCYSRTEDILPIIRGSSVSG